MIEDWFIYILGENLARVFAISLIVPSILALFFLYTKVLTEYFDNRNKRKEK